MTAIDPNRVEAVTAAMAKFTFFTRNSLRVGKGSTKKYQATWRQPDVNDNRETQVVMQWVSHFFFLNFTCRLNVMRSLGLICYLGRV